MFTATATTSFARSDWMWTFSLGGYGGPWEDAGEPKGVLIGYSRYEELKRLARSE
jgi:hypothetical protein